MGYGGQNQFMAHGLWVLRIHEEEAQALLEGVC